MKPNRAAGGNFVIVHNGMDGRTIQGAWLRPSDDATNKNSYVLNVLKIHF